MPHPRERASGEALVGSQERSHAQYLPRWCSLGRMAGPPVTDSASSVPGSHKYLATASRCLPAQAQVPVQLLSEDVLYVLRSPPQAQKGVRTLYQERGRALSL